ncbi:MULTISPECIES: Rho termination factor N-terminal domain-containing protein [unclassified Mycoplasma]|uniref:Rho termination factor N-terminal domain-containing protein n=1 Tax=unclassified Mycoplasma TaxID=2683645 RepID=UPI000FDE5811
MRQQQLMGIGNFNNVPRPKDLWKNEKNRYRHWIILFGIGFLVILAIHLTGTILNILDRDSIVNNLEQLFRESYPHQADNVYSELANRKFTIDYLTLPIVLISVILVGLTLYLITVTRSYRRHSFSYISTLSIYIIGGGALMAFVQVIMMLLRIRSVFDTAGSIFQFVNFFVVIGVWCTCAVKVNAIRKQFSFSEYVERLRHDERFIQWQQQMEQAVREGRGINPLAPFAPSVDQPVTTNLKEPTAPAPKATKPAVNQTEEPKNLRASRLKTLKVDELREIAKKLSIFGSETMNKEELVSHILRVTSGR